LSSQPTGFQPKPVPAAGGADIQEKNLDQLNLGSLEKLKHVQWLIGSNHLAKFTP
jgi:hypothetical protein